MSACDVDPFDTVTDLEVQGYRVQPRFQVFCGVDSAWRLADTDLCGRFVLQVYACDELGDALATARLLNAAEVLAYA